MVPGSHGAIGSAVTEAGVNLGGPVVMTIALNAQKVSTGATPVPTTLRVHKAPLLG